MGTEPNRFGCLSPFEGDPSISTVDAVSENARFYPQKMAAQRQSREPDHSLQHQMLELLRVVADCEARWALDVRMERRLGMDKTTG